MSNRVKVAILVLLVVMVLTIVYLITPCVGFFLTDPFLWAFISMFAFMGCSLTLCTHQLGKYPLLNMLLVAIFAIGRIVLVLPFCSQPRFDFFGVHWVVGFFIFVIGLAFLFPVMQIKPWPAPEKDINLITTGYYGIIRNPIYFGEILWSLGWSIIFRSVVGVVLIPFWLSGLLFHIMLEEEELERRLGQTYSEYKSQVRGRIIPGIPI